MFERTQPTTNFMMSPEMRQSIQNCDDCSTLCLEAVSHCLQIESGYIDMNILLACAEMCQTTSNVMMLNSQLQTQLAALCVEACETCADHLEQRGYADEQLLACAEMCRRCAETCYYIVMLPMYYAANDRTVA